MENGKYTILVVDDSGLVLRSIKEMLQEKYNVKIAVSGQLALKFVPESKPDLILLDYEMPGMNGSEVFDEIKKLPDGKDVPILFLTSIEDKHAIDEIMQKKPAGYLMKPPKLNKITEAINQILGDGC